MDKVGDRKVVRSKTRNLDVHDKNMGKSVKVDNPHPRPQRLEGRGEVLQQTFVPSLSSSANDSTQHSLLIGSL
ncbi:hypothetical protein DL93DRAFT_2090456, partial [Clavulina sp. PMI_390]